MKERRLGIDAGTNSLRWAVVDRDENGEYFLVLRGDLIFQEGVKIEKGIESSKASERTGHKALRTHYFRRRLRKIETLKVLIVNELCPFLSDEELRLWHTKKIYPKNEEFMDWQRTNENTGANPYYYRHVCLHEKLDLEDINDRYVLGRALYHLTQRRGFLSNRLDNSEEESETGKVKTGISNLEKEIREAGCKYLGDYFYKLYSEQQNRVRIRERYTDRELHYKKEFYAICRMQQLDDNLIVALEKALYFQRPLKSQRKGVGKCTFEPHNSRAAESHPEYEEFRMLCFINNIKIKTPSDFDLRKLNEEEKKTLKGLFYRKSKVNFDFEDIAKAIAGKNNYQWIREEGEKSYKFNYRMSQGVSGCPTTAALISILGEDWKAALAETYTLSTKKDGSLKSIDEIVNDIWNVLFSFSSKDKLKEFATDKLQLDEDKAKKFSEIKLTHAYASLSLKAIRKILPFLREGMIYSHAVSMANIPTIVTKDIWNDPEQQAFIRRELIGLIEGFNPKDKELQGTLDFCIKDFLLNNYALAPGATERLYHPSMIETYVDAKKNADGIYQLGSPRTNAIRNPMAMRSLHQIRKVINQLLKDKVIDNTTKVHIEYARELNDANKRKAIADDNKKREKERKNYRESIIKLYQEETGIEIVPTETDVLKFQLWEEQNHKCIYTGKEIGISQFLGNNPQFDIEHTIPRSVGGDSTTMNLTLCDAEFNRQIKKTNLPSQLATYDEILVRIASWKEKVEKLTKDIDRIRTNASMAKNIKDGLIQKRHRLSLERDYWRGKYERFTMKEVPEGFSRRQGAGIGLVSKYAGLYLKSLFHNPNDRNKTNVRVIKGEITAEFRKMWGIQNEYEKKSRDNHAHHCIDAIVIACIGANEYNQMAHYYHELEAFEKGRGSKPSFPKPWVNFVQDIKALEEELIIVHSTNDNLPKSAKQRIQTSKGTFFAQGDCARGSLHKDSYYGAIERNGEIRYVIRRALSELKKPEDLENIVDDAVKAIIKEAVAGKNFKEAIAEPIYMNRKKGILIKRVRCYTTNKSPLEIRTQRDESSKEYKRPYYVANDNNYMIAVYEGKNSKGKITREFDEVKMIDAARYFKESNQRFITGNDIVPTKSISGYPLLYKLKIGTMVLLYENNPDEVWDLDSQKRQKRLYKITSMSLTDGRMELTHHQEARPSGEIEKTDGAFKIHDVFRPKIRIRFSQFKALIAGVDFEINLLGQIKKIR